MSIDMIVLILVTGPALAARSRWIRELSVSRLRGRMKGGWDLVIVLVLLVEVRVRSGKTI